MRAQYNGEPKIDPTPAPRPVYPRSRVDLLALSVELSALLDRKCELRRIIGNGLPPIIFADHIYETGIALFENACELDLEGIVAKHQHPPYDPANSTWFKIRNPNYSQMVGREELLERERHREPVPGWHICALAAAANET